MKATKLFYYEIHKINRNNEDLLGCCLVNIRDIKRSVSRRDFHETAMGRIKQEALRGLTNA